jgi:NADH:quinone reductase (non-electrogenic)
VGDPGVSADRPRVLILGGGFAGVGAAQKLEKADAEVVVVDRHDYHTFQPLLYQLATGLLETTAVGHSLRDLLERQENTSIHKATVSAIDLDAREVTFAEISPLSYDYLVLGLGAEVNFFGTDGAEDHAFPMYTQGSPPRALGGRRARPEPGRGRCAERCHRRGRPDRS